MYKPYLKEWVVKKGNYGKRLTETTFIDALNLFFNDGRRTRLELISSFIERLKEFLHAMEARRRFLPRALLVPFPFQCLSDAVRSEPFLLLDR